MLPPTHGLRTQDARKIIAAVGGFRATRNAGRSFTVLAGQRVQLAYNETPFPLSVIVNSLALVSSFFGPFRDSVPGFNALIRPVSPNAGANSATFVLKPYGELWVSPIGVGNVYRVTEVRV
jgi:hypothetical protein